jgi:rhamnulokinase
MHGHSPSYLAFDLGAESGRAVLGTLHAGVLVTKDVHRFPNEPVEYDGSMHWDIPRLWREMRTALRHIEGVPIQSMAVDTWGVDYALLGEGFSLLENPYHYRDRRTDGVMDEVFRIAPPEQIYATTGIQFMPINTLYQLFAASRKTPLLFHAARALVTIPDLFNYWLTGRVACEYTNATTTQMVNPRTRDWSRELMRQLGLPQALPAEIVEPGTILGELRPAIAGSTSLTGSLVVTPACHDTGSAVAAIATDARTAFLSSGTWSLVGVELDSPIITDRARELNFTNEGGVCGTTRLLKNVMGLWMLQGCRRCWSNQGQSYGYQELIAEAEGASAFQHWIDPDHPSFLNPENMVDAIDLFCESTGQGKPASPGEYARAILESLALKYRSVLEDIESLTGRRLEQIRIIGGGSANSLLNRLTADCTGKRVIAGPLEATALGNIAMQMLATGAVSSLAEARRVIENSFPLEVFEPEETGSWERYRCFLRERYGA